jgi:hypothetical protein
MCRRENSWPYRESNSYPSIFQTVASHYTDWAIPAPTNYLVKVINHEALRCAIFFTFLLIPSSELRIVATLCSQVFSSDMQYAFLLGPDAKFHTHKSYSEFYFSRQEVGSQDNSNQMLGDISRIEFLLSLTWYNLYLLLLFPKNLNFVASSNDVLSTFCLYSVDATWSMH